MKVVFCNSVLLLLLGFFNSLSAQVSSCVTSAVPPIVSSEGYAERVGDIIYNCNGVAGATISANFTIAMNTNISNRISTGNILTGIVFTIDQGSGPQPVLVQPLLNTPNTLVYNGVSVTFSPQGTVTLRVSDVRVNATLVSINQQIIASLGVNVAGVPLTSSQLTVGTPQRGLYVGYSSAIVCAQNGSPLPDTIGFASLLLANTVFASTRVTEGFADALGPRSAGANFNADSGQRIIARYSGLPQDARLFVPDVVAGSDSVQPTAGGDFGVHASGGQYAPSANGSLLLAHGHVRHDFRAST
jgi:hypothetical protein